MSDQRNLDALVEVFTTGRINADGYATGVHAGVAAVLERIAPVCARAREDWCEEDGEVIWWQFPLGDRPFCWCGTPQDSDWPGFYTHFTPLPPRPLAALKPGRVAR